MKEFIVSGMTCTSCSQRVEKEVNKVDGVNSCNVSLLTNTLIVDGEFYDEDIINSISRIGYKAKLKEQIKEQVKKAKIFDKKFIISLLILLILMYVSTFSKMFDLWIPLIIKNNPLVDASIQMVLSLIIILINYKLFKNGFKGLIQLKPNMDSLVTIGSSASFIYSTIILFKIATIPSYEIDIMSELYFESSAMILVIISIGKKIETISKNRTTDTVTSLMKLSSKKARVIRNNEEFEIEIDELKINDLFIVRPGQSIPIDGRIVEGSSTIDESMITGESIPNDKTLNDYVIGGTINKTGVIKCVVTKELKDTTLSKIIDTITTLSTSKAPIQKLADKVSYVFVPLIIIISIFTLVLWLVKSESFSFALERGISVLVISCPCALGLATPVAIMVGSGVGAKNGILYKDATTLEMCGKSKTIALDKTGTITYGNPIVNDIICISDISQKNLLEIAYAIEEGSIHPIAKAIISKCKEENIELISSINHQENAGLGINASINNKKYFIGKKDYISSITNIDEKTDNILNRLSKDGKTPVIIATSNEVLGVISVVDEIKEDSILSINKIKKLGLTVVMITGDNESTALSIQNRSKIDEVYYNTLPLEKNEIINELKSNGPVIMVGDGINDAVAITNADIGMSIGNGTDIANDASDIILMNNSLNDAYKAIKLSRGTIKTIKQNLFFAFFYNALMIPLAMGFGIELFNIKLTPAIASIFMSISSITVVLNALRLNTLRLNNKNKGENQMNKKIIIEGLMCHHCEMHVKNALENLNGVDVANVNYKTKEAIIKLSKNIEDALLVKTIEDLDYKVITIENE